MDEKEEREYRDVCCEMTDQVLALASRVAANAVNRGISYRLACHAVKVAIYQGLFSATLRQMKNDKDMPSALKMEEAFVTPTHHESVAHEVVKLIFDHLQVVDRRFVWGMNIVKRQRNQNDHK